MSGYRDEALKKLREGAKNVKGQKETAMKEAVRATLETFCTQDEEFAQAVAQGGDFPACMAAVARGVGSSISDLEAYKKAVPISKALALLSVPESERIEFAEVVDAEHISVRELEEKIRDRERQISALQEDVDGERKRLEESERLRKQSDELLETQDDMLKEAKAQIAELAKLNKELENRPVEVAVETVRDEAAIAVAKV